MRISGVTQAGKWLAVLAGLVLASGLSGCGRRGPLEPPPGAVVKPAPGEEQPAKTGGDTPFILDPLI
ncbi:MAG: lipoprotein [Nitratireductor sp.]|nr:lipoprotein [Nitratireductor sp.]